MIAGLIVFLIAAGCVDNEEFKIEPSPLQINSNEWGEFRIVIKNAPEEIIPKINFRHNGKYKDEVSIDDSRINFGTLAKGASNSQPFYVKARCEGGDFKQYTIVVTIQNELNPDFIREVEAKLRVNCE